MEPRLERLRLLLVLALSLLVVRLAHLQLIRGAHYRQLADQNRLRLVPEPAPRGLIVDRRGMILAANQTMFRVAVIPQELDDLTTLTARVGSLVGRSPDSLRRSFLQAKSLAFLPATILSHVPKDAAIRLEEARWRLPGLLVKPEVVRHYPLGSRAAHLLGHLSQPTAEEFPLLKQYGVRPTQLVGRMGIEQLVDHALRGRSGGLMVEVDHRARQVGVIGSRPAEAGATVALTIDAALHSLIEESFGGQAGAAVVLEPKTGAVLAMVSLPAFFPEAFVAPDAQAVGRLLGDAGSPLMNRAVQGYQPGSILKVITAAAALEAGVVTPSTTMSCPGSVRIGDRTFHCWNRDGHGALTLPEALAQSCNVYFLQVARALGAARLRHALEQAGISHRTGWPLDEEVGHLPQRTLTGGEVAMLGIGQGEVLMTALQGAIMAGAFATGGWVVEPWVVRTVADRPVTRRPSRRRLPWSAETIAVVREAMERVVREPAGTGHGAFSRHVRIAGKTGTAQTHVPARSHGWFIGFCPVDAPRAAVAIVAEHGGSGGDLPAHLAKVICEYVVLADTL